MKKYNLSPNRATYYSQRNNTIAPGVTCKPTSTVECLAIAGWPLPTGSLAQPEDNLTAWCRQNDGYRAMAKLSPDNHGFPNEDWRTIAYAINEVYLPTDKPVIGPRWDWELAEVLHGVAMGRPFAASTYLTPVGHIVSVVGFETEQDALPANWRDLDMAKVSAVIIDDPYGKHQASSGYKSGDLDGWNCRIPIAEWLAYWRKTGIQVRKKGA